MTPSGLSGRSPGGVEKRVQVQAEAVSAGLS